MAACLAAGCGRLGFESRGEGDGGGGGGAPGDIAPPGVCGTTAVLSDNFSAATIGPQWTVTQFGNITVAAGGALVFGYGSDATAGSHAAIALATAIDFTSTCTVVDLQAVPVQTMTADVQLIIGAASLHARFDIGAATLTSIWQQGNLQHHVDSRPYDPVAHRYLRLRNGGGTSWYWEASADGATFTTLASAAATSVPMTTVVEVLTGASQEVLDGGNCQVGSITITR